MRTHHRRVGPAARRRPLRRRLAALLVLAAFLALGTALPADAHAGLASSDPAAGSVLDVAPSAVRLSFTEPVDPVEGGFALYTSEGRYRPGGDGSLSAVALDTVVTVDLPADLPRGSYLLGWRVVSPDSHPVSGVLAFAVGETSAAPTAPPDADSSSDPVRGALVLVQVLAYVGLLGAVGLRVFDLLLRGPRGRDARAGLARGALVLAVVSSALVAGLGAVRDRAGTLPELASPGTWSRAAASPAAVALGLVVGGGVLLLVGERAHGRAARVATLVGALVAVGAVLPGGHTRTTHPLWLMNVLDLVHASAAAVWFGGLLGLVLHLRRSRRTGTDPVEVAAVVVRFSALAGVLVVLLGISGAAMGVLVLDAPRSLWATTYGRALATKLAVVGVVAVLAVWNKVHLLRVVGRRPDDESRWRRLRSAVVDEAVLLVVVLAVTGLLTMQDPGAPEGARPAATSSASSTQRLPLGTGSVQVRLAPARVGANGVELSLRDADGAPLATEAMPTVSARLADGSLGPLPARVTRLEGAGRYRADVTLPEAGRWQVQVSVRTDRYSEPTALLAVDVAR
ncbi:copper resistance CopC/CopD family protein [Microlunatus flavus]|uniref:Copper transport protein n=1 Tax=Microlunatus flavus TaxID=1036181 RepID=A0A1H9J6S2_9ACTN|nr:copper resistance protein CopC [Microlunatus flavus]SEQ82721.1 copper transport protein [Microlunatus flavus]